MGHRHAASEAVSQKLVFVGSEEGKMVAGSFRASHTNTDYSCYLCRRALLFIRAVRQLVQQGLQPPVLVFVQSRSRAQCKSCEPLLLLLFGLLVTTY